jgi:hypothetical protein
MKNCTKCLLLLPSHFFGKKKSYQDGLQYWCKSCHKEYKNTYYKQNLRQCKQERLIWKKINKIKVLTYQKKYISFRYQNDKVFRIIKNQRNRIKELITNKSCSFSKSIGCSSDYLKWHLESKFQPGMNWDNYGKWHVDHIKPLSSFDLTKEQDFKNACHYTNLQPLWAKDNIIKSNKLGEINAS